MPTLISITSVASTPPLPVSIFVSVLLSIDGATKTPAVLFPSVTLALDLPIKIPSVENNPDLSFTPQEQAFIRSLIRTPSVGS